MADNYLEKKMEEHRAGVRRMFKRPKPSRAVFVTNGLSESGKATLRVLHASGDCRIAFAGTDYTAGTRLAQALGARFYCLTPRLTLEQALTDARHHFSPLPLEILPG